MKYVFTLESIQFPKHYYIGITKYLKKRLAKHNAGESLYTSRYRLWWLKTYIGFTNNQKARDFERYPLPGQHNWWRGDHISVYDKGAREQIAELDGDIDMNAIQLWGQACDTRWEKSPVWIHGDFASGNILVKDNKLSGVIDFGGMAMGDPACDLVIAWTFLKVRSSNIFKQSIGLDADTWLRARAWALWKASFELCQLKDRNSKAGKVQKEIIQRVLDEEFQ